VSEPEVAAGCDAAVSMRPPARAAAQKNIPMNNSPLPRKTVAKKRSSRPPIRSRSTPTNQRNAIPANGTRFRATATAFRRPESLSHWPALPGSAGVDSLSRISEAAVSSANAIPAAAAARGVRSGLPASS
jgi:hypothetical protein